MVRPDFTFGYYVTKIVRKACTINRSLQKLRGAQTRFFKKVVPGRNRVRFWSIESKSGRVRSDNGQDRVVLPSFDCFGKGWVFLFRLWTGSGFNLAKGEPVLVIPGLVPFSLRNRNPCVLDCYGILGQFQNGHFAHQILYGYCLFKSYVHIRFM